MASPVNSGVYGDAAHYPMSPLWMALRDVEDPELGISVVDLGLIVDVRQENDQITVQITYTSMGCPATELIESDIHRRLLKLPGVNTVNIEVVWDPVWTRSRLSDEARDALLLVGITV